MSQDYKVKIESILIGDTSYSIRGLLDRQQFSDPDGIAERRGISSAQWPIFGVLWPMGKVLAHLMLTEPLEERRIMEIGCGLALPSIVTKHLGGDITASDYHPLVAPFLQKNVELNGLSNIPYHFGDWNKPDHDQAKSDLIIGSDLLYETQHIGLLSKFINVHASENAQVILLDPGRGSQRRFVKEMGYLGFECEWTDLKAFPFENTPKGYIFRFHRNTR